MRLEIGFGEHYFSLAKSRSYFLVVRSSCVESNTLPKEGLICTGTLNAECMLFVSESETDLFFDTLTVKKNL